MAGARSAIAAILLLIVLISILILAEPESPIEEMLQQAHSQYVDVEN